MNLLLFAGSFLFLFIPFLPALIEFYSESDTKPLSISKSILKDPRENASSIYWYIAHLAGEANLEGLLGRLQSNDEFTAFKNFKGGKLPKTMEREPRIVSAGSFEFEDKARFLGKMISFGSIKTGQRGIFSELHAKETLSIAYATRVAWWASGKQVFIEDKVGLPGKVSADDTIVMGVGVQFHQLSARTILTGSLPAGASSLEKFEKDTTPVTSLLSARVIKNNDFTLEKDQVISSDLIVQGNCTLEMGARVLGSLKAKGHIVLKSGASVAGNLVSLKTISLQESSVVEGNVLAGNLLKVSSQCILGTPGVTKTYSGERVELSQNVRLHGVLKAWKQGRVVRA